MCAVELHILGRRRVREAMSLSIVVESLIPRDPAVLSVLAIVVRRCQPRVQHLLTRCSRALRQTTSSQNASQHCPLQEIYYEHSQSPILTLDNECTSQKVAAAARVFLPWQHGPRPDSGGTDHAAVGAKAEDWFQTRTVSLPEALTFRPCMYDLVGPSHNARLSALPCAESASAGFGRKASVLELASFTSYHSNSYHSSALPRRSGAGAIPFYALTPSILTCLEPTWNLARGFGTGSPRGLHSTSGRFAASFENIGEASARRATALQYRITADDAIHRFQVWDIHNHWHARIAHSLILLVICQHPGRQQLICCVMMTTTASWLKIIRVLL